MKEKNRRTFAFGKIKQRRGGRRRFREKNGAVAPVM